MSERWLHWLLLVELSWLWFLKVRAQGQRSDLSNGLQPTHKHRHTHFIIHKSSQDGGLETKEGVNCRWKFGLSWKAAKGGGGVLCFAVCVSFLSGPWLEWSPNTGVLTTWWMNHGKVVSDCKSTQELLLFFFSKSTNKWLLSRWIHHLNIGPNCKVWPMVPETQNHRQRGREYKCCQTVIHMIRVRAFPCGVSWTHLNV